MRDYYLKINNFEYLTREKEYLLSLKSREGDPMARERLILSHLRIVPKIARRYNNWNISFDDLIQEGNLALILAVDNFDPEKEIRLVTYARMWVNEYVKRRVKREKKVIYLI